MVSDFLVSHSSSPFFRLNDKEYSLALEKYPELADYDHGIIYEKIRQRLQSFSDQIITLTTS